MLPPKLRELRRALSQTVARTGGETPELSSTRRGRETLERTRCAEADADTARITRVEFRKFYGYDPPDAPRMREIAEYLLADRGSGSLERHGLDARSRSQMDA